MIKGTVAVFVVIVSTIVAARAMASPMTWNFAGSTSGVGIPEIPIGSPVTVSWTFDSSTPNACPAGDPDGAYFGQSTTVTINSTIGPLVYHAAGGLLLVDTNLALGCTTQIFSPGTVEARIFNWSGPDLGNLDLFVGTPPFPGGLFWDQLFSNGAFPAVQPHSVLLQGPFFFGPSTSGNVIGVQAGLQAVPEPVTAGLVGCGLLVLAIGRRRGGRPARER
jgi:hypothetical protein